MATLREFEDALRELGLTSAIAVLEKLRERDRARRTIRPARRLTGKKMTPELARRILEMHERTGKTQQEIAFEVGVNQGRVNEVIKRGKWLNDDPAAPEAVARDKAKNRMQRQKAAIPAAAPKRPAPVVAAPVAAKPRRKSESPQLAFGDF